MTDMPSRALTPHDAYAILAKAYAPRVNAKARTISYFSTIAEIAFIIIGIMLFGTDMAKMLTGSAAAADQSTAAKVLFMLMYAVSAFILLRYHDIVYQRIITNPVLFVILLFPLISAAWSVDRNETITRGITAFGSSLFGILLISRFSLRDIIILASLGFSIIATLDLLFAVAVPSIGRMTEPEWAGVWRGLHLHKNTLGAVSALGATTIIFGLMNARGPIRFIFSFGLLLCIVLLIGSKSTSALLNFIGISGLIFWGKLVRRYPGWVWSISLLCLIAFFGMIAQIIISGNLAMIFEALGKNSEMSGRFPLWQMAWENIQDKYWLGFGYMSFWSETSHEVKRISMIVHYVPYYSHNGVLEMFLNGGMVLVGLFMSVFVMMLARSIIFLHRSTVPKLATYPLIFCCFFISGNFAESKILVRNDLVWIMFVAMAYFLSSVVSIRFSQR